MTRRYLDAHEVADRVGLSHQRVRVLRSAGQMPEPDAVIGRAVGWLPETIDRWRSPRKTGGAPRSGDDPTVKGAEAPSPAQRG